MTLKTKSVLSYFGSDSEVASAIGAMFDKCRHVTIPFVGGASILPNLSARAIVANDKHSHVINFYRFASGRFGDVARSELVNRCQATLSHPDEISLAAVYCELEGATDSLGQAWAYWALCWIGRKGKGGTRHIGGMPSVRRSGDGGTNASRLRAAANDLDEWKKHLERCEWEAMDFRDLLPKVADRVDCGVYCDPPWVDAGKNYLHPFVESDHRDLARELTRFENATLVVRYGDDPLIRELYSGWTIIEASSRDQCNAVKNELWITNR
jgi:site-specific DNA-adenine methylase